MAIFSSMQYNPTKHHRRSIRMPGWNYGGCGTYFITLCVQGRECLFGNIVDGNMVLNEMGHITAECWKWIEHQYGYVKLDEWVVMPNHLHGINVVNPRRGDSRIAPTGNTIHGIKPLGRLIGAFKTVSTKRINALRGMPGMTVWQRNYHEHVIRNDEINRIRTYIANNPKKWESDDENPESSS